MTIRIGFAGALTAGVIAIAGCGGSSTAPTTPVSGPRLAPAAVPAVMDDESKKIGEGLAKLSQEDRKLAEEQKFCPESGDLLGSMGAPIKVALKNGKTVFVCCDGCVKEAEKDPEATLKKIVDLKAKNGGK
jgi:hypothetical protein